LDFAGFFGTAPFPLIEASSTEALSGVLLAAVAASSRCAGGIWTEGGKRVPRGTGCGSLRVWRGRIWGAWWWLCGGRDLGRELFEDLVKV
jgi:hypothetical protein